MQMLFKKVISLILIFGLMAGGITYTKDVEAATDLDLWKENAVTVPAEGELIGAGYIDVEFDNSMEGYTYTVYLDGKPMYWIGNNIVKTDIGEEITGEAEIKTFTSEDEGKTEVYTTAVSKHEITIKADNGTNEYVSEVRTFYVSKKGMALGGDMSDRVSLKKLNCSWYYNWATTPFNNSIDEDVTHIPMMWGDGEDAKTDMQNFTSNANYILGFNEPDIKTQADMLFFEGIDIWKEYISPLSMRKVSPAPAAPGGDSRWLNQFMYGDYKCINPWDGTWGLYSDYLDEETKTWVGGVNDEVDSVVLHYYRNQINLQGLLNAVKTLWETYHKPIWITEISVFGIKGLESDYSYEIPEKRKEMAEYVEGIVKNLDAIPYVERYCWFSYDIDSTNEIDAFNGSGATAMFEYASGKYTELGRLYSSIGNPSGYNAETITDEEMFVYVPEQTTQPETTKKPNPTTQQATTKVNVTQTVKQNVSKAEKRIKKPGKVKIKSAKNIRKRLVKLTWKRISGAKRYQIQYAMNRKFKKKVKSIYTKKLTFKVGKLKYRKKYYFRVRAINTKGKGKWSNVKMVKVRK